MIIDKDATLDHDEFSANLQVSHQEDENKEDVSGTSDRMQVEDSVSKIDLVFKNICMPFNICFYSFFFLSFLASGLSESDSVG